MRLYVGIFRVEKGAGTLNRQFFGHIDKFAATVIAFFGVAFGIFVGQDASLGFHDRPTGGVFRGNQLKMGFLSVQFLCHRPGDFRVYRLNMFAFHGCSHFLRLGCDVHRPLVRGRRMVQSIRSNRSRRV